MKQFKKVYIEMTNNCNLNCDFCIKNKRVGKFIKTNEFNILLEKLKKYTNYLYFHVLGEPLLHPQINELIDIASTNFKINITTNGYLIDRIKDNKNIRQLNISLHSFDEKYNISLSDYLDNIFNTIDNLKNTYISLRLWVKNKHNSDIIDYINERYNLKIDYEVKNCKINSHIFINNFHEFNWPDLNNEINNDFGKCYALKDHIGILVDGTVVPCCLDSEGIINLGNIYENELNVILNSNRAKNIIINFRNNKKCEALCKHCDFFRKED